MGNNPILNYDILGDTLYPTTYGGEKESYYDRQLVQRGAFVANVYNKAYERITEPVVAGIATDIGLGFLGKAFSAVYKFFKGASKTEKVIEATVKTELKVEGVGKTKAGDVRVKASQGERKLDITKDRVKETAKELRNPNTGTRKVNFKKEGLPANSEIVPNSKGLKRTPTPDEQKLLDANKPKTN